MARIKFGALVTSGSGSLGGHTIQHSRGGMQLRNKPINKKPASQAQLIIRSRILQLQGLWRSLTNAQRSSWNIVPFITMAGHSYFIQYNMYLYSIGYVPILSCPAFPALPWLYSYPSVLIDGSTKGFYDSTDLSSLVFSSGTSVEYWNDKLLSANNLFQTNPLYQPTWSSQGLLFDGANDRMSIASMVVSQPLFYYIVLKQVSWTSSRWLFDGISLANSINIVQLGVSPRLYAYSGIYSSLNSNLPVGSFGIIRALFSGASSKFIINSTTPITGNFGSNSLTGFRLATRWNFSGLSNIQVKELIIRNKADTAADELAIYTYLSNKYSIV
jgi:hypothetical protein